MKKIVLYISLSTICLGLILTNCSKKADPAPAATASTTGTTTSGTTTGSTTSSTTAGSTTNSTTSGSSTSNTTAGSTTSNTTSGSTTTTKGGSGTFSVDGVKQIPSGMIVENLANSFRTIVVNNNYVFYMSYSSVNFASGIYPVSTWTNSSAIGPNKVIIEFIRSNPYTTFLSSSSTNSSVTISGRNVTFNDIKLKNYNGKDSINISGNYTFDN